MILLDTTILAYAVGGDHPLAPPCRAIVDAVGDGRLQATTTVEVVQEFVHVHSRRGRRNEAVRLGTTLIGLLSPLISVDTQDLQAGLRIFAAHPSLGAFDAVLAAVAVRRDVEALVSADAGFRSVAGLRHLDPSDGDAFRTLIG